MTNRLRFSFTVMLFAAAPLAAQIPETVEPTSIPNYHRFSPSLATGGQPTLDALRELKAHGFKTVLSLRSESEGPPEESEIVEGLGLGFLRIPVASQTLSMADAEQVAAVLDDPDRSPVLLHCASSNRVGAIWALIERRKGKSIEEALAAGEQAGLRSPQLIETVKRIAAAAPN